MKTQNIRANKTINAIKDAVDIDTHRIVKTVLEKTVTENEFTDKQYIIYSLTVNTKRKDAKNTILDLHIFAILGVRGGVKSWYISSIGSHREGKGLKKLLQWIRIRTI